MDNLQFYELSRAVPAEAKKTIAAGRLKGMTDINPMWRIKKLTELFGPCGIGWWYIIKDKRLETDEATQQIAAFVDIDLYYVVDGKTSMPIPGTGGSMFVAKESKGFYTDDECYKKALTDAISVAAKALGIGADVYWEKDRSKYGPREGDVEKPAEQPMFRCAECGEVLKPYKDGNGKEVSLRKHAMSSEQKFGKVLCLGCIRKAQAIQAVEAM